ISLEYNWSWVTSGVAIGPFSNLSQFGVTHTLGQPDNLEGAISLQSAGHIIVDTFAGTRKQAWSRIVFVHDEIGVGLVALQRNADDHLAQRGAGHRIGSPKRLGTKQDVDPKCTPLAHDPVQQKRRGLGYLVVLDEKLLEFVDQKQGSWNG